MYLLHSYFSNFQLGTDIIQTWSSCFWPPLTFFSMSLFIRSAMSLINRLTSGSCRGRDSKSTARARSFSRSYSWRKLTQMLISLHCFRAWISRLLVPSRPSLSCPTLSWSRSVLFWMSLKCRFTLPSPETIEA